VDTQLKPSSTLIIQNRPAYIQALYNQYGAMLLGYIFEVVKNMTVAEQYLVAVFKDLPHEADEISKLGVGSFCQLQMLARKKLSGFFDSVKDCAVADMPQVKAADNKNKYIALMTSEQKLVFCGVYWHGKSMTKLAAELEKTEDAVKRLLKECFTTIRNSRK
jgi:hypothetical protein